MQASEIITEVRQIVQETDPDNTHASDTTILGWINACTLQLCSTISTLPKVSVSGLTASATLTLSTNVLRVDFASIADANNKHSPLTTIDFTNFARINPNWQDTALNKPSHLIRMTDLNWMMWPNPDATWSGKTVTIIGAVLPTPLATTAESPAVSIVLHPAYVHYCCWKFFLLLNNPERAAASFAAYDGLRKINTQTATSTTGSLLALKMRGM